MLSAPFPFSLGRFGWTQAGLLNAGESRTILAIRLNARKFHEDPP
jgi:hypothetical protein